MTGDLPKSRRSIQYEKSWIGTREAPLPKLCMRTGSVKIWTGFGIDAATAYCQGSSSYRQ